MPSPSGTPISYWPWDSTIPITLTRFTGRRSGKRKRRKKRSRWMRSAPRPSKLSATLAKTPNAGDELLRLRHEYLQKQVAALAARVRMLKGEKLRFDDESRALYDAVAPTFPDSHFNQFIAQLDAKIPGKGPSRT